MTHRKTNVKTPVLKTDITWKKNQIKKKSEFSVSFWKSN